MSRMGSLALIAGGVLATTVFTNANAQDTARNVLGIERGPLETSIPADRPSFGDNPSLIPKGYFETEGGYQFDNNQDGGHSNAVGSGLVLRAGLTDNLEFRLGWDGYTLSAPGLNGASNANVGFKIRVKDETGYAPSLSVLPTVSLPVGNDDVAANKAEPELHFIFGKTITDKFSLSSNLNLAERETNNGNLKLETAFSFSGGYGFTDRVGSYLEYYAIFPAYGQERDSHVIDGGFTFLTTRRAQLDAYVGTGLNDVASNVYAGVGIAHLF